MELLDQNGDFVLDNVPNDLILDAKIAVNQPVPRTDNLPLRNVVCKASHMLGNVRCGFAHHDEIMYGSIVIKTAGHEPFLIHAVGIGGNFFGKADHVGNIKSPFSLQGVKHGSNLFQYKASTRGE